MKEKIKKLIGFLKDWKNQSRFLKWMIAQTRPFFKSLMLVLLLNLLISLTGIGATVVSKYIIDSVAAPGRDFTTPGIVLLVVLTLLGIAVNSVSGIITTYINEKYAFSIRDKVYDKVLRSKWRSIVSFHSGDVLTRLTSDVDSVANGISSIIPNFIFLFLQLVIAFFVLYYYDPFLAVTALLLGPVGILSSLAFSAKLKKYQEALKKIESEYRSFMQESIENMAVIKTFQQEEAYHAKLLDIRSKHLKIIIKRNKLNTAMSLCIRLVFSLGYLVAFGWSIYCLQTNRITYGTMTLFLSLVAQVQGPIMGLGGIIPQFINVLASTGRIMEIDSLVKEEFPGPSLLTDTDAVGIRFENVSFAYDAETVLEDVSLDIRPNTVVGIVGASGIGKTTLARLILSLIEPQGLIKCYNARGVEEVLGTGTRSLISYVPQGNTLFSGTIADNLKIGKESATEEEMWRVLKIADADAFVSALPGGLYAHIGENTLGLSAGQAQRIGIARAIIKASPVLILDESTSALDAQTEETILRRLCESAFKRTCIVITHRPSMLKFCDKALKIADKKVAQIDID